MLPTLSSLHLRASPTPAVIASPSNLRETKQKKQLLQSLNTPFQLKQIHAQFLKTRTPFSFLPLSQAALICASSSEFDYARSIFARLIDRPEIFVWNSCLKCLVRGNSHGEAARLFLRLRQASLLPDAFTCSLVLVACLRLPGESLGVALHGVIEKLGFQSDSVLQNAIAQMYSRNGAIEDACHLFDRMIQRDVSTWNALIIHLAKRGELEAARKLFDEMPNRSEVAWTAMIARYVQYGNPDKAIQLFQQMERAGLEPNRVTAVAVLASCADLGALELGQRVHYEHLKHLQHPKNVRVCNTLVDMYIKCGCLEIAQEVFKKMERRTVVSWSIMIGGFALHGRGEEALQLFSEMTKVGPKPNGVTFIGLLHACSHMGLVDEGFQYFALMTKEYHIMPQIEHYGCMVDLLSRVGLLQEAREFICKMPIKPNGVVWGALLGGCRVHKNVEMAEEIIGHLLELDPLNGGYYVVLSNIYAQARRWKDVVNLRRLMRDQAMKKIPGRSSITIGGVTHEFVAGDCNHPQSNAIYKKWQNLLELLKMEGYVPDTSCVLIDVDEVEKLNALYRHSEKLAVTFGLLITPHGTPLRIMKNLRICGDCHFALKLISKIANRQIVVRDRNRFHHFIEGSCSCKDYW